MSKDKETLMSIVTRFTNDVRAVLSAGAVSPKAFVDNFTKVESLILDLKLERNKLAASVTAETTLQYKKLRYASDELAGHQEATRLVKGEGTVTQLEKQIADLEAYISHLKGLIDLMSMFEKMTRY